MNIIRNLTGKKTNLQANESVNTSEIGTNTIESFNNHNSIIHKELDVELLPSDGIRVTVTDCREYQLATPRELINFTVGQTNRFYPSDSFCFEKSLDSAQQTHRKLLNTSKIYKCLKHSRRYHKRSFVFNRNTLNKSVDRALAITSDLIRHRYYRNKGHSERELFLHSLDHLSKPTSFKRFRKQSEQKMKKFKFTASASSQFPEPAVSAVNTEINSSVNNTISFAISQPTTTTTNSSCRPIFNLPNSMATHILDQPIAEALQQPLINSFGTSSSPNMTSTAVTEDRQTNTCTVNDIISQSTPRQNRTYNSQLTNPPTRYSSIQDTLLFGLDNNVVNWSQTFIPLLKITDPADANDAIKTFMDKCYRVHSLFSANQRKLLLNIIWTRFHPSVSRHIRVDSFHSLEHLEETLRNVFPTLPNRDIILSQIRQTRQKPNETVCSFVSTLRNLMYEGLDDTPNDPEFERAAILQLRTGLYNDLIYSNIIAHTQGAKSFEEVAKKAIEIEKEVFLRNRYEDFINPPTPHSTTHDVEKIVSAVLEKLSLNVNATSVQPQQGNAPNNNRNMHCFYCGKKGHFAAKCYKRIKDMNEQGNKELREKQQPQVATCERCRRTGHKAALCSELLCGLCGMIGHLSDRCPRNLATTSKQGNYQGSFQ